MSAGSRTNVVALDLSAWGGLQNNGLRRSHFPILPQDIASHLIVRVGVAVVNENGLGD